MRRKGPLIPSPLVCDPAKGEPLEIQKLMAHAAQVTER